MPTKHNIGSRIRSFREEREIDLETLSQDTNLSVEFLNQLENGEIYPSIGPMQKLARALGVRLGTFLDDQYTRDPIIGRIGGEGGDPALHTGRMARPTYVYHALGKGKSDRNMEPFYIEIFPDPSVERKTSSHQGEEFILVLEGELLVIYGRESHVLKAGDTIYYNSIVPHFVGAAGERRSGSWPWRIILREPWTGFTLQLRRDDPSGGRGEKAWTKKYANGRRGLNCANGPWGRFSIIPWPAFPTWRPLSTPTATTA